MGNLNKQHSDDYESGVFTYSSDVWVVVFNFCRDTRRTCFFNSFPAYMNAPNRGMRCIPTITSGSWDTASYGVEHIGSGILWNEL